MTIRRTSIAMTIGMLVSAALVCPTIVSAQTKALVKIVHNRFQSPSMITAVNFSNPNAVTSSAYATIGTGPTPSIMLAPNVLSLTQMTIEGPFSPPTPGGLVSRTRTATARNAAVTLKKNWTHAAASSKTFKTPGPVPTAMGAQIGPATGPSLMGSTFMAANQPAGTTICFTRNPASAAPNGFPGQCATRTGTLSRVPGAKKFGGAANILVSEFQHGVFQGQVGTIAFSQYNSSAMPVNLTGMVTPTWRKGTPAPGKLGNANVGIYSYFPGLTVVENGNQFTVNPHTTGMASVHAAGYFSTSFAVTGSNNLNPTNLTGTVSLVQPMMFQSWSRNGNVFLAQQIPGSIGMVLKTSLTFLPEPTAVALLGFGALGLIGLGRMRRA